MAIVTLLVLLWRASSDIDTGVRGFLRGEALWSKARYEAIGHLERYLVTGSEGEWIGFLDRLEVPLADRRGRLALNQPSFDFEAVSEDLVRGENHPDDVPMMIRLYRGFAWQEHFERAIALWEQGDGYILELLAIGEQARALLQGRGLSAGERAAIAEELRQISNELAPLERAFSMAIGDAGRWVDRVGFWVVVTAALLLVLMGADAINRLTARLFEAEERFRRTFEEAPVGIVHVDLDGLWLDANEAVAHMLGVERDQLAGTRPVDFLSHPGVDVTAHGHTLEHDRPRSVQRYRRADGEEVWLASEITTLRTFDDRPLHHVAVVQDVTESRRLARELAHRAQHDHLTGLINRFELERRLQSAIERVAREGTAAAIGFLDLDEFKVVNDTGGHHAGDALLTEVTEVVRSCLRASDTLARLGGDEFVMLLEECDLEPALAIAENVRRAVRSMEFTWNDRLFPLTVSIGVVAITGEEQDPSRLLSAADAACYAAKRRGRDVVHLGEPGSHGGHGGIPAGNGA